MVQLISRKPVATTRRTLFEAPPGPEPVPLETPTLSRPQLLERIIGLNATATEEYLGTFSDRALAQYLAHLESAGSPRGARWERPGDSPAILVRETAF